MGGNNKLFAKNWKKLISDKYILDIATNGLRSNLKEFSKSRQCQSKILLDNINWIL